MKMKKMKTKLQKLWLISPKKTRKVPKISIDQGIFPAENLTTCQLFLIKVYFEYCNHYS